MVYLSHINLPLLKTSLDIVFFIIEFKYEIFLILEYIDPTGFAAYEVNNVTRACHPTNQLLKKDLEVKLFYSLSQ